MANKFPIGKEYLVSHSGQSAIICGSAPCLLSEFEKARQKMPDAVVFAINEAAWGVYANFLVSYHAEKFDYFKSMSLNPDIITLTGKGYRDAYEEMQVDYRFTGINIGGTSLGDAVQIALKMGFSEIVIVGAPLNGLDGYYNKTNYFDKETQTHRFGSPIQDSNHVELSKEKFASIVKNLSQVKAMSGYTKQLLGAPEWLTQT